MDTSQNEMDVEKWSVEDVKEWAKENYGDVVSENFESKSSIHADSMIYVYDYLFLTSLGSTARFNNSLLFVP